jgi:hypothetical protein
MNALDQLKKMLKLDRKTLRIEDIAPLVKQIEKDHIRMAKKLSKVNDLQVKLDLAKRHNLTLSAQLFTVHEKEESRRRIMGK